MFCVISFLYILVLNRAAFFTGEKKRSAFLDFMIESSENGVVLTEEEIKEQVDTIMFEVRLPYYTFITILQCFFVQ